MRKPKRQPLRKRSSYSRRLLDKLVLIAAEQTSGIRESVDDDGYAALRGSIVERVAWALWGARQRLQKRRVEFAMKEQN